jgi:hypothetical protein
MQAPVAAALVTSLSSLVLATGTWLRNSRENKENARENKETRRLQENLAKAQHDFEERLSEAQRAAERELREEERRSEAKKVLDRYRGPLMDAAWQLGNRIDNIRTCDFLRYLSDGSGRERDVKLTTMFRFAHYLGWREFVRGEVLLLRFENEADTRLVAGFINDVARILASNVLEDGRGMLWADEQRGIGELMASNRSTPSPVRGHAAFHGEYEEVFASWMDRFAEAVVSPQAVKSDRLRLLHWALFGLVQLLDEEGAYGASEWLEVAQQEISERAWAESTSTPEAKLREHLASLGMQGEVAP